MRTCRDSRQHATTLDLDFAEKTMRGVFPRREDLISLLVRARPAYAEYIRLHLSIRGIDAEHDRSVFVVSFLNYDKINFSYYFALSSENKSLNC